MNPVRPRPRPARIYAIADAAALAPASLPAAVAAMAGAGIEWIQLRAKSLPGRDLYGLAEACRRALAGSGSVLWIDDRADVAALLPGACLHLGQSDLPAAAAREVVGDAPWIGVSTHAAAELAAADSDPAVDVVAVGPIFPTSGKERPEPVVGLSLLRWARARTAKPLIAIGGIDAGNVAQVLAAGADSAAVLGAVYRGNAGDIGDIGENCRRLLAAAG
ncbi:MAG TPA: thiamine phosphate synthase [Thermoanaerobaculia bacterium]|nr:thiamine phosphate synthase [Thermoanaerobaculia bacterium]